MDFVVVHDQMMIDNEIYVKLHSLSQLCVEQAVMQHLRHPEETRKSMLIVSKLYLKKSYRI